ncbi:molybdopterin molybdotransferase MoeA [Sporosarcina thermotolerans]|uniref:Molybdopterin molybdenumtransferase n=1 Tax=Sporosarcina thermotolerans TaxID=633404 RepID=A0AAW9AF43_9BACL|nr:gephyrin-like molybdotransferase Glp [Sporosarcina thermotolerans]MDW0118774.1 molybdopterin molybdotransferase MoeA [Sporosarcina thermotolerans]
MVEIRKPIPVAEAVGLVMEHVKPIGTEIIDLEQSYGRVLAEPIIARHDVPPFDRSPYDGFAIRSLDSKGASGNNRIPFSVIGEIGAGYLGDKPIGEKEAYRIMTGAQIPGNADAVVMLEQSSETEGGFTLRKPFEDGENISYKGEDAKEGELLIEAGSLIHPGTIALLATFGYAQVKVAKRPVAGILSTGTELLEVGDELVPGKIRNSNGPMIKGQLNRMGISYRSYGMAVDDLDACTSIVKQAIAETDFLITTGGVSVGDYDYLPAIYERLGAKVLFNKVAMRPGSVTTVAVLGNKFLFGLSGNPSACFTGFELLVRPAILAIMGGTAPYMPRMRAKLGEDFTKPNPFTRFIRATWTFTESGIQAVPAGFNKSNAVSSIARGNCLIVLPSGTRGYATGDAVDILLLGSEQGVSEWTV